MEPQKTKFTQLDVRRNASSKASFTVFESRNSDPVTHDALVTFAAKNRLPATLLRGKPVLRHLQRGIYSDGACKAFAVFEPGDVSEMILFEIEFCAGGGK